MYLKCSIWQVEPAVLFFACSCGFKINANEPLFGRLLIRLIKGQIFGRYAFNLTKYLNSVTGEGGIAARWGSYLNSKHGGNKKLRELYDREDEEYFQRYFEFTFLEYFGMSYDPLKVLEREQRWKDCLDTRAHGYNDN